MQGVVTVFIRLDQTRDSYLNLVVNRPQDFPNIDLLPASGPKQRVEAAQALEIALDTFSKEEETGSDLRFCDSFIVYFETRALAERLLAALVPW